MHICTTYLAIYMYVEIFLRQYIFFFDAKVYTHTRLLSQKLKNAFEKV